MPRFYCKKDATVEMVLRRAKPGKWSYEFSRLDNGKRAEKTIERAERAIEAVGHDQEFLMVHYGSDGSWCNYLKGANIAGFIKVADAIKSYGVM